MNSSNHWQPCQNRLTQQICTVQTPTFNVPEFVALPCFVLVLVLILRGGRQLSVTIASRLYLRYQIHQMAIRFRQVEMLEYLFTLSSSSQERS